MQFDAIVIGTGMGGGAVGYSLAQAGCKVLFLERGLPPDRLRHLPDYAERAFFSGDSPRQRSLEEGSRSTMMVNGKLPVLGSGLGGSSAVYGAALLPLRARDFESWPLGLRDIAPYYQQVDALFEPRGTDDPLGPARRLREPAVISPISTELWELYRAKGLHPFRTPIAYDEVRECGRCFGFFCGRGCKRTAGNVFVAPALKMGAEIAFQTQADTLVMEGNRAAGVRCTTPNGAETFHAKSVFVAAGALATPVVLRRSRSEHFPHGIGNHSDQLGRHLMRHLVDFYALKTESREGLDNKLIEVSVSDFYADDGEALGLLNSVGTLMSPELTAHTLLDRALGQGTMGNWMRRGLALPLGGVLQRIMGGRMIVTSIMPDEGRPTNRIGPHSTLSNIEMDYRISSGDRKRLQGFRKQLTALFRPLSGRLIKVAGDNLFLAHACGTCRMGHDPSRSVVDARGLVHGTANVFVSDTSVYPTSGAANPSMTAAAWGLRTAAQYLAAQQAA